MSISRSDISNVIVNTPWSASQPTQPSSPLHLSPFTPTSPLFLSPAPPPRRRIGANRALVTQTLNGMHAAQQGDIELLGTVERITQGMNNTRVRDESATDKEARKTWTNVLRDCHGADPEVWRNPFYDLGPRFRDFLTLLHVITIASLLGSALSFFDLYRTLNFNPHPELSPILA